MDSRGVERKGGVGEGRGMAELIKETSGASSGSSGSTCRGFCFLSWTSDTSLSESASGTGFRLRLLALETGVAGVGFLRLGGVRTTSSSESVSDSTAARRCLGLFPALPVSGGFAVGFPLLAVCWADTFSGAQIVLLPAFEAYSRLKRLPRQPLRSWP